MELTKEYLNQLSFSVIGAAIEVHKTIGPGLLESVYHTCFCHELKERGFNVKEELAVPVVYKGINLRSELRCDFLVNDCLVVEIKSVVEMVPVFEAQLLTYMNLLQVPKGILINFNVKNIFVAGQKTYVNELYRNLPD